MHLKKYNKEPWEISEAELIDKFLVSELYQQRHRCLKARLALFIATPEPNGLNSTFLGDEFFPLFDMLELVRQRRAKDINVLKCELRVKKNQMSANRIKKNKK